MTTTQTKGALSRLAGAMTRRMNFLQFAGEAPQLLVLSISAPLVLIPRAGCFPLLPIILSSFY